MRERNLILPDDPEELRGFTARPLAEVKAQAILTEKLCHQLAGHRAHRFSKRSGRPLARRRTEELEYLPGPSPLYLDQWRTMSGPCEPDRPPSADLLMARESFVQAPLPTRPIKRGRPGPGLLAQVLLSQIC